MFGRGLVWVGAMGRFRPYRAGPIWLDLFPGLQPGLSHCGPSALGITGKAFGIDQPLRISAVVCFSSLLVGIWAASNPAKMLMTIVAAKVR